MSLPLTNHSAENGNTGIDRRQSLERVTQLADRVIFVHHRMKFHLNHVSEAGKPALGSPGQRLYHMF